jgi:urease accessory protein UreE
VKVEVPFQPEGGAYGGNGHHHNHGDGEHHHD